MKWIIGLATVIVFMMSAQTASAGPLRDLIMKRFANRQSNEAQNEIEERTGTNSGFNLPSGVKLLRDIPYGPDSAQRMDVYIPKDANNAFVIFMVHGGAWSMGDKTNSGVIENKVLRWLPKGIIIVSINYRMLPKTKVSDQAKDVAMALTKAQILAESWGGNSSHFVLMGHSAGAHLIALLASDPNIALDQGAKPWLGAVFLDSAALDVVSIMESKHLRLYDKAFVSDPVYWQEVSPYHCLVGKPASILAVCSTRRQDSCSQARKYVAKVTALGGQAEVLAVDMPHSQINKELGLVGTYTEDVESFLRSLGFSL